MIHHFQRIIQEAMKQIKAMSRVSNKILSKSITLDDIRSANHKADSVVKEEVMTEIYKTLKDKGGTFYSEP